MSLEIRPVSGLGEHVVLDDGRPLFVARTRERAERFCANHVASRLIWAGRLDLAQALDAGEIAWPEAVASLEEVAT